MVWVALSVTSLSADAGPYSEVASALDEGDSFDLTLSLEYGFDIKRGAIKREGVGFMGTGENDPVPLLKDLVFEGSRHTLTPKLELGVFTDLSLSAALPIVISDSRTLKLDQRADPCLFPADTNDPTCIDRTNSTTILDGILPDSGFDADDPGGPGFTSGETIFRSPGRAGLDQVHLGLTWAPMNQQRDDTKPTWKIGAEARIGIGKPMRLDPVSPSSENSVGRGLHEVKVWTSIAKRVGWAEPFVEIWWMAPFAIQNDSVFQDLGYGMNRVAAQQNAGTRFGFEAIAWEKPEDKQRVALSATTHLAAHFEGRAYSEMWEVFQYAGIAGSDGPLELDSDPTTDGQQVLGHPGVTNIENYIRWGGQLGVQAALGENVHFGGNFQILGTQAHVISFDDAGVDLPTCSATTITNCELESNNLVNPGTEEVNPAHVPLINLVGQRYIVDELTDYVVMVDVRILF